MNPDDLKRLRLYSAMFFAVQEYRKAINNRLRLNEVTTDEEFDEVIKQSFSKAEKEIDAILIRNYRETVAPSILQWQRHPDSAGIGEHLLALLLGTIGHPRVAAPFHWEANKKSIKEEDSSLNGSAPKRVLVPDPAYPRNIAKLWAYCGHGDPDRKRRSGMTAEQAAALGSPRAKKTVWLLATSTLKAKGMYYRIYEEQRLAFAERVHAKPCPQCGTPGKPAPEGSPWRPGHQHAAAVRRVGKEILRDLWLASPSADEYFENLLHAEAVAR